MAIAEVAGKKLHQALSPSLTSNPPAGTNMVHGNNMGLAPTPGAYTTKFHTAAKWCWRPSGQTTCFNSHVGLG